MKKMTQKLVLAVMVLSLMASNTFANSTSKTATPSKINVLVDGVAVPFGAYNIDGFNYFKLTDISYSVDGAGSQFLVSWDAEKGVINMNLGQPHKVSGRELEANSGKDEKTEQFLSPTYCDGVEVYPTVYIIDGSSYFQLASLVEIVGFSVGWNGETSTISIDSAPVATTPEEELVPESEPDVVPEDELVPESEPDVVPEDELVPESEPDVVPEEVPSLPSEDLTPEPTPEPEVTTPTTQDFVEEVHRLVNIERANAGLSVMVLDNTLCEAAQFKSEEMYTLNYFDHDSPVYGSFTGIMKKFGVVYSAAGENIAKGQTSPEEVMNSWMNSSGHKANILSSSFNKIGIGYENGYWTQQFTN